MSAESGHKITCPDTPDAGTPQPIGTISSTSVVTTPPLTLVVSSKPPAKPGSPVPRDRGVEKDTSPRPRTQPQQGIGAVSPTSSAENPPTAPRSCGGNISAPPLQRRTSKGRLYKQVFCCEPSIYRVDNVSTWVLFILEE